MGLKWYRSERVNILIRFSDNAIKPKYPSLADVWENHVQNGAIANEPNYRLRDKETQSAQLKYIWWNAFKVSLWSSLLK